MTQSPLPPPPQQRSAVAGVVAACLVVVLALVAGGVLLLRGPSDEPVSTQSFPGQIPRQVPQPPATVGPCTFTPDGAPARPVEPPTEADLATSGTYEVTLETSAGRIAFDVDAARTPCTLTSLRALVRAGWFESSPCHRLTTAGISVLQCGDPTGTGSGGPGYVFDDEALDGATYPRGTVAMANRGPATNGSQFFLVYGDTELSPDYTPFGRITQGLDVLERVAAAGSDDSNGPGDGAPRTPVLIRSATVAQR